MRVFSLVHVSDPARFEACTLNFATFRVGFPTATISIWVNGNSLMKDEIKAKAVKFGLGNSIQFHERNWFHPDWIAEVIRTNSSRVVYGSDDLFAIVDPDTIFWKKVEDFRPSASPWMGMYVPEHMNPWSETRYMSKIHTSFLVGHARQLIKELKAALPRAEGYLGEHFGYSPFHPVTVFEKGVPVFYDTCAIAYQAISGAIFTEMELDCYDHLNSSSYYEEMLRLLPSREREDLIEVHQLAITDPTKLKGLWRKVQRFYDRHSI